MGTTWSAAFTHPRVGAEPALATVQAALDGVVAQMSPWEPGSDLNRYNRAPAGAWIDLPDDLLFVLDASLQIAAQTDGAFDPTLGALTDLWGFGPVAFRGAPPTADEVAAAVAVSGWRRLMREGSRLLQPGGLGLDLGGVAKGFGVDKAVDALLALGVANALVEVGGELKGVGAKPDGSPWWAAVEADEAGAEPDTVAALSGWALATSADHRRAFIHDGLRYGHTLDPAAGVPRRTPTLSASVLHTSCMLADAYATAALVMAPEAALRLAEREHLALRLTGADGAAGSRRFQAYAS
ncbi:FAD:protein FMN transferase [soil metagenome]